MGKGSRKKRKRVEKGSPPEINAPPPQGYLPRPLAVLLLLSLLTIIIYSNTFSSPFYFDDTANIVENPQIKDLKNFLDLSGTRYVGFLSFALNYHFGGLNVFGFHLVNLLIHIINGFLVYSLVLLLFKASASVHGSQFMVHSNSQLVAAPWIALATALLFVAHPIQTQAVTYIVQRFASLVTLFYLLTVVCYLKWRLASQEARNRYLWYGGAVLCTVLAMKTKENSFTLPFMILLVEVVFFRPFTKKRWVTLIPFLLTLLIIPISRGDALGEAEGFARDTATISRSDYLFTQFRVIVTYLRLLVFPVNQNLDYDYPIYHSLLEPTVLVSFLFFLSLFSLGLYLLFNSQLKTHYSQLVSFGILWFFLALSIESSIIPITDVIFEHRLYLPSVGFFLVMILGMKKGLEGLGRRGVREGIPFILVLASLSIATFQRNVVWKDGVSLWKDVMEKSPNKARGHENLGVAYKEAGLLDLAIHQYREALRLQPEYPQAYNDLGIAYTEKNLVDDAKSAFYKALELWPNSSKAHNNLGAVYKKQGILDKAISEYQQAIKLDPDFADAHNNLGVVYVERGLLKEGITEYRKAIKLKPVPEIYYNLATALELSGEKQEAIEHYQQFIELAPEKYHLHVKKAKNRSDELRENYTPISK